MSVIVPIEKSSRGGVSLERAIEIAQFRQSLVKIVLHRPMTEFAQESIDEDVDALSETMAKRGVAFTITTQVGSEDLAEALLEYAFEESSATIVVEIARRPVHGRLNLGAQIQRLLVDAPCDVLVVRAD